MSDASASLAKSAREYVDKSLGTVHEMAARIAELEAELAALKARRCEGCEHVKHHAVGKPHAYRLCALGNSYGYDPALPDDFACNRWTGRETP